MSRKARRTPQMAAVAYMRTRSATNVGPDKDSLKRQLGAVRAYAKNKKLKVVREFYDPAVSGADPIQARPGFGELLAYVTGNGAWIVLVEKVPFTFVIDHAIGVVVPASLLREVELWTKCFVIEISGVLDLIRLLDQVSSLARVGKTFKA